MLHSQAMKCEIQYTIGCVLAGVDVLTKLAFCSFSQQKHCNVFRLKMAGVASENYDVKAKYSDHSLLTFLLLSNSI